MLFFILKTIDLYYIKTEDIQIKTEDIQIKTEDIQIKTEDIQIKTGVLVKQHFYNSLFD